MSISKKEIRKVEENFAFHTEENYLRIILESYLEYNHKARLEIAKILFKGFKEVSDDNENLNLRKNLYAEIINKLMQSMEDAALIAMMFSDTKKSALEHYVGNDNSSFVNFFKKAKKGLSDAQILRMYGLRTVPELIKKGLIEQSEKLDFQNLFQELIYGQEGDKRRWKGWGKVYIKSYINPSNSKRDDKKSNVVAVYHNIKHAYKVLIPTNIFKQIWKSDDDQPYLDIITQYTTFKKLRKNRVVKELKRYENKKLLTIGGFELNQKAVEEIFERIFPSAQVIKNIAYLQLKKLDNPAFPVREFRFVIFRLKNKGMLPKHFDLCPCKSGLKFKKCHALEEFTTEDLIYKPEVY